ncbi:2-phosphoglycolate phosphatase [Tilletiaria anomala UBC 951]|uniref:4-nitrophenylphosphatase n=1 Tax=Tilletiaria anomala (strain ATCC 24038 / CBS 436.72 / UBC 951) TaxID=1037660 RepID=A0A066V9B2_TILAU|nr:2-phosphoglycolate phosphatase [Tilletiaria anomala UBC 951]KDN38086.1 2-phosphoglycolate phosphatase [Tilletiaria anomala UBC 951]
MAGPSPYQYLDSQEQYAAILDKYDTFLFDCDGVIWSGDDLIPGAKSVLAKLRKRGKQVVFVTNNASKSRMAYLKKFEKLTIQAELCEVFSSSYAAAVYISKVLDLPKDRKVYVIGMEGIEEELKAVGLDYCGGTDPADKHFLPSMDFSLLNSERSLDHSVGAVLCGFDMHINYLKLAKAFKYITRDGADGPVRANETGGGCHFLLTNDDSTFPARGGPWPGSGALSAPLLFASGRAPIIIGKPNKPMLDCIEAVTHFDKSRAIFVGDRLNTDIQFGINGGIDTMLVLTGISKRSEIDASDAKTIPTYCVDSLGSFDVLQ